MAKRSHWFEIKFKRENAAFFNEGEAFDPTAETLRILDVIKNRVVGSGEDPETYRIVDINGNVIGEARWQ